MSVWAEVAAGVWVRTSRKMTTTTTYVAGVLVDPAWLRDELEAIAGSLPGPVRAGFATHAHHDHLLWHPAYGEVPRWASRRTAELALSEETALRAHLGADYPEEVLSVFARVTPLPADVVPGTEVEVVVHDGHAPGHAALFDPASGVLVAGDMLSDVELPLPFWPDDLPAYLEGLDRLAQVVGRAAVLVPGHGHPTERPMERLDADRRYLDAVLAGRVPDDPRMGNPGMAEEFDHLVRIVGAESE